MTDKKYQPPKLLIPLDERGEHFFNQKASAEPLSPGLSAYYEKRDRLRYLSKNWNFLWTSLFGAFLLNDNPEDLDGAIKDITERGFSGLEGLIVLANEIDQFLCDPRPRSEDLNDLIQVGFEIPWSFDNWDQFGNFLQNLKAASLAAAKGMSK